MMIDRLGSAAVAPAVDWSQTKVLKPMLSPWSNEANSVSDDDAGSVVSVGSPLLALPSLSTSSVVLLAEVTVSGSATV